ncbi:MAG: calcineurin-like phosphoesterase C-terminal domain-containing protein, partial [Sphingobacterium sp.]
HAETLLDGFRPSQARQSTHLWQAKLSGKLAPGEYQIQVRATDMFGRTHLQTKELQVVE